MQLSIGDKVVYPGRGVGQITGMEHLDLVDGFERYCVIDIPNKGLTVRVPVRNMEELGVRPVMSRAQLDEVLATLRHRPRTLAEDYKERQDWVRERLETGGPLRVARIVRDLTWHQRRAHLTKVDTDLLARGLEFLSTEMAFVTDTEVLDAKQAIDDALTAAMADELGMWEAEPSITS